MTRLSDFPFASEYILIRKKKKAVCGDASHQVGDLQIQANSERVQLIAGPEKA